MISSKRLALLGLVFAAGLAMSAASAAQGLFAQSGKVIELIRAGRYAEALPLAQAMVAQLDKGAPNRDLAGALNNLGQVYSGIGRDAEAEPLYERALAMMGSAAGIDSAEMAPVLNNLAALYQRQERYAEAEPLFKRALALREKALPPGHPDVGQALNNLAQGLAICLSGWPAASSSHCSGHRVAENRRRCG